MLWCSVHGRTYLTDACELSAHARECWAQAQRHGGAASVMVSEQGNAAHTVVCCDSDDLGWMQETAESDFRERKP